MSPLITLCLCVSPIWALSSSTPHSKDFIFKFKNPRIINGNPASEGQFPWQAALFMANEWFTWFCGGSIISEEWILTAGHCVKEALSAQIVTGSLNVHQGTISNTTNFITHEGFDFDTVSNDIGLARLDPPLKFDENTAAISLSTQELGPDVDITISGWGYTSDTSEDISELLNYVELVTITNDECQDTYGVIRPEMICANSPSSQIRSSCSGDSGGPAVVNGTTNPVHVAIVSFVSTKGCEAGLPSGYTRTAYYRDWIKNNTGI
ncbi:hypothetical protein Zmor_021198 [Zophobas morio]|uniref:Peptidase S1 domain-containing protein n=1 Tax=Zophobas morio TaxID=2755281 RepID=A0AA38I590_9CUCU|nr:hypothetical protein Zmor_021198 [Zophobas morio]